MRVLWFTNDPMPAVRLHLGLVGGGTGYWMPSLLDNLLSTPGMEVEICTAYPGLNNDEFESGGVRYFVLGQPKWPGMFFHSRKEDIDRAAALVRRREPDIVHIHGTERFYGLMPARKLIDAPCVISLQGLLGPYLPAFFGALSPLEIWQCHRFMELAIPRGPIWTYREFARGARAEREILAGAKSFLGRTDWDRAHVKAADPEANYYHVGEVLRPEFADRQWDISRCDRHSVIFTNAGEPRRGTEILLRAMAIVRRVFPDATLRLAGNIGTTRGYDRFLRRKIEESGLSRNVELLGYLDGSAMAGELCRAHAFAISSYMENSPNSLCEAMQVGLPCVASYVGGIPSLIDHGQTGFLYPPGDAQLLADGILRIFRDDNLSSKLSRAGRAEATRRHSPQRIVSQLLNAYNSEIHHGQLAVAQS